MIEIITMIKEDFSVIVEDNDSDTGYYKCQVSLSENILTTIPCDEDGEVNEDYCSSETYGAILEKNDTLMTCIRKKGWVPVNDEIDKEYKSYIAERDLLGGDIKDDKTKVNRNKKRC